MAQRALIKSATTPATNMVRLLATLLPITFYSAALGVSTEASMLRNLLT